MTREGSWWPPWLAGGAAAALAVLGVGWWLAADPYSGLTVLRPGLDGRPERRAALEAEPPVRIGEHFEQLDGRPASSTGSWPRFRGPEGDNISTDPTPLARAWPEGGPPVLWTIELGEGHAGAAVHRGRVYLLDYDETLQADTLRCLSLADGREIWRRWYEVRIKRNHGISRTIPAVTDEHLVTIGPRGHVMCLRTSSGELLWTLDLERDHGVEIPFWYTGQCPIIVDGVAVLAPAGDVLLMGVDCATGEVLWQTPNPHGWKMSHTSIVEMELGGRRALVYSAIGGMVAVSAEPGDAGRVLWESDVWSQSVLAPSPVVLDGSRIFVTAGYGAGSMMLRVVEGEGSSTGYTVEEVQRWGPSEGLASEQQTAIRFQLHLLAIQPKDAGALRNQLVCYHPDEPTRPVWSSGSTTRFGLGPYLIAGDRLLVLDDDGLLVMAEASISEYRELARAQILDGVDAWGPMALVDGLLLLRDSTRLACVDLRASAAGTG